MEQNSDNFVMGIKIRKEISIHVVIIPRQSYKTQKLLQKRRVPVPWHVEKKKNVTSEDLQNSSASTKTTILQYSRKRGLHEVSR